MALALALTVALRLTHSQFILFLFYSWDRLALPVAAGLTSLVYPDDLPLRFGLSIETFFEAMLILGAGVQCSVIGCLIGWLLKTRRPAPPFPEETPSANPIAGSLKQD